MANLLTNGIRDYADAIADSVTEDLPLVARIQAALDGLRELATAIDEAMALNSQQVVNLQAEVSRLRAEPRHAAKRQDAGWIEWGGGKCPVPEDAMVEIKYNSGAVFTDFAKHNNWEHVYAWSNIVAYRVIEEASHADTTI